MLPFLPFFCRTLALEVSRTLSSSSGNSLVKYSAARFRPGFAPYKFTYAILVALIALTFLLGGGSRADIQSLVILRPLAALALGFGLWNLSSKQTEQHRAVLIIAAFIPLLVLSHLIPLPTSVWSMLPGREIVEEIDTAAGIVGAWRPISLSPTGTWNALYSLMVPLAVLVLACQLGQRELATLIKPLIVLSVASGVLGILQVVGDPTGPLYLYRITNNGSAVGLFSNRNHQAILLATLFPLLATYASLEAKSEEVARLRTWLCLVGGAAVIPLLLVTGSRAGLLVGGLGLIVALLLYRKPQFRSPKKRKTQLLNFRYLAIAFGVLCLAALTIVLSRAEALQRLSSPDQVEDLRFKVWGPIWDMSWSYFPVGSGIGSFSNVYDIHEPLALLGPSYLNHAHNDWLEVFLTAGLPGVAILVAMAIWLGRIMFRVLHRDDRPTVSGQLARLGGAIILILGASSIVDYPLRTPSLSVVFAIALVWLSSSTSMAKTTGDKP
jgi:O-antigen ligase